MNAPVDAIRGEISSIYLYTPADRLCVRGWFGIDGHGHHVEIWCDDRRLGTVPVQLRRFEARATTGREHLAPGWCFMTRLPVRCAHGQLRCVLRDPAGRALTERSASLATAPRGDSVPELLEYEVERYEPTRDGPVYAAIDRFMGEHPFFERWRGYTHTHLERFNRTAAALEAAASAGLLPHDGDVVDLAGAPYLLPMLASIFPDRPRRCLGANLPARDFAEGRCVPIDDLDHAPLAWPDRSVAMVTFLEVIEHLYRDPMHALGEINRILVDDGLLLVTTPNITSTLALSKLLRGQSPNVWRQYQPFGGRRHVNEFAPADLRCLMEAAGFEVRLWTENCYIADTEDALGDLLARWGSDRGLRGDTIFALGRKVSPVRERYPAPMYCPEDVRAGLSATDPGSEHIS